MKKNDFLKKRKWLAAVSGRLEYMFFTSIMLSAAAVCAVLVLGIDALFRIDEVRSVYTEIFSRSVESLAPTVFSDKLPEFVSGMAGFVYSLIYTIFENAPSGICFFACLLFIFCPVYQGTVRWSAYLTEEERALPLYAVLFYFTSPRLYFKSVWLSFRLYAIKTLLLFAFVLPPTLMFGASYVLCDSYFENTAYAGAALLLSLVLLVLSLVLYAVYTQKFFAVRYFFALGQTKKLFKASAHLTKGKRAWLFSLSLRLSLNLLPAVLIFTAPISLSQMINGKSLAVKNLVKIRKLEKLKPIR